MLNDDDDLLQGLASALLYPTGTPPTPGLGSSLFGSGAGLVPDAAATTSLAQGLTIGFPDMTARGQAAPTAPDAGTGSVSPGAVAAWTPAPAASADEVPAAADAAKSDADEDATAPEAAPFDADKAIAHLDAKATPGYDKDKNGHCAAAVREAIAAGGRQVANTTYAKDYGPNLVKAGFNQLDAQALKNYTSQKGDVVVIPAMGTHTSGHMEMYDGKRWVSDFMQNSQFPLKGVKNPTPYAVYRP